MSNKPKPTHLKLLAGNPGRRPINHNEPQPSADGLACPDWLAPEAKDEWARIVPQMKALGVFTEADQSTVMAYCHLYGRFQREVTNGEQPAVTTLTHMRQFASELGLTPSSRSKISVSKPKHDTKAKKYFA